LTSFQSNTQPDWNGGPTAVWVKCTNIQGGPIYINREAATSVTAVPEKRLTLIAFAGKDAFIQIRETPEQFLQAQAFS
jgi:uncharacterized protein YlzI (FlbEa/FlbD family)